MEIDQSVWGLFAQAGLVVKFVMLLLLAASVISWTYIIQRALFFKGIRTETALFEKRFWSGADVEQLYMRIGKAIKSTGVEAIFYAGYKEFKRCQLKANLSNHITMDNVQRAMRTARAKETEQMEKHLPFLATVGSTSPYVGLFGTVWGIMHAFNALGAANQATIAMVAPGIAEALVATAMGLFAAIPAVIAYNRYSNEVDAILNKFENFEEEFYNILQRETPAAPRKENKALNKPSSAEPATAS